MRFDKIIVIGSNTVACECVIELCDNNLQNTLFVLEYSNSHSSLLSYVCKARSINYSRVSAYDRVFGELMGIIGDERALIISAGNMYIFCDPILSNPKVEIINFHYSLLPKYRGLNIPAWVIYNDEKETGITWHYVTKEIDNGNILSQRTIKINYNTTAYEVIKEGMRLSRAAFCDFYLELLDYRIQGKENICPADSFLYLSKMLPNDGIVDLDNDDILRISRTLRAYDHHGSLELPQPILKYAENKFRIKRYRISPSDMTDSFIKKRGNDILITGNNFCIEIYLD